MSGWRFVSDTRLGISHANHGRKCQDFALVIDGTYCLVSALSDGIGSREHSEIAAEAAVTGLCKLFSEYRSDQLDAICSDAMIPDACAHVKKRLLSVAREAVEEAAANHHLVTSSMDCTLVFVCVVPDRNQAIIGRIGDSAVCIIRRTGKSEALSARSLSANRTHTLLQTDAANYLEIQVLDLSDDDIAAFVLSSDGLNNEIYMKGSDWVCHNAEEYVNALCERTPENAKEIITARLETLTRDYSDIFRDDISYTVLSRAREPISLPPDPTWLCTCGTRNHLWETYCRGCHMDFVKLYRNVNFAGEGKAAFFSRLNADEAKERRTIGLPVDHCELIPLRFVPYILSLLILLILCWNLWIGYSLKQDIHLLSEQVTLLQNDLAEIGEKMSAADESDTADADFSLAEETEALNERLHQFLDQYSGPDSGSQEDTPSVDID